MHILFIIPEDQCKKKLSPKIQKLLKTGNRVSQFLLPSSQLQAERHYASVCIACREVKICVSLEANCTPFAAMHQYLFAIFLFIFAYTLHKYLFAIFLFVYKLIGIFPNCQAKGLLFSPQLYCCLLHVCKNSLYLVTYLYLI